MATLNAGALTEISLSANQKLVVSGGDGIAIVSGAGQSPIPRSLTIGATFGPYGQAMKVQLQASRDLTYTVSDPSPSSDALNVLVSGAGNALTTTNGFDVPATETSGGVWKDASDCQCNISARTEIVAPHANAGYISSEAGASKYAFIPVEKFSVNMETDSFMLSFMLNLATPGASQAIAGFGISTTYKGLYFSVRTTGEIIPIFWGPAGQWTGALTPVGQSILGIAADGTDHTVQYEWCAKTRTLSYRLDGVLRFVWHNAFSVAGIGANTAPLAFGAQAGVVGTTAFAAKFKYLKGRVWATSGLPLNMGQIARAIASAPGSLNYLNSVTLPTTYSAIAWIGQSNQLGSGDQPDTNGSIGAPARDTVLSGGSTGNSAAATGSMHPAIAALGGKRGTWRQTYNTAIGATSLLHYWVGSFVSWVASTSYGKGAYCVAAGKVYKFTATTNAVPTVGVTAASQPTWPGSGTVVDGEITWTYVRASTAADVVGSVIQETNPLFDPNGAFAAILALKAAAPAALASRFVVCQAHGESDSSIGTTLAQYTDALRVASRWARGNSMPMLIGLTNGDAFASVNTWLTNVGLPARAQVLSEFSSDASFGGGTDAFTLLGPLTYQTNSIGVVIDNTHVNRFARDLIAADWDAKLAAKGF